MTLDAGTLRHSTAAVGTFVPPLGILWFSAERAELRIGRQDAFASVIFIQCHKKSPPILDFGGDPWYTYFSISVGGPPPTISLSDCSLTGEKHCRSVLAHRAAFLFFGQIRKRLRI
jgi:hypothetical protein